MRPEERFVKQWKTPGYRENPYPALRELSAAGPVHQLPTGHWLMTGFDEVSAALKDTRLRNSPVRVARSGRPMAVSGTAQEAMHRSARPMSLLDGPEHLRIRRAAAPALSRDRVVELTGEVEAATSRAVESLLAGLGREVDLFHDFALPIPLTVACELFEIPPGDRARLGEWGMATASNADPDFLTTPEDVRRARAAERHLTRYFVGLMSASKRRRANGVLDLLQEGGGGQSRLSVAETLVNSIFLFVNDFHNIANVIALGALALLSDPAELARARHRHFDDGVVDELLRYDSAVQSITRVAEEPHSIGSVTIPAQTQLILHIGAAHRDPQAFRHPERLDFGRTHEPRALSFGGGKHHCLGTGLAHLEASVALDALFRCFPQPELSGPPRWSSSVTLRGPERVPVRFS